MCTNDSTMGVSSCRIIGAIGTSGNCVCCITNAVTIQPSICRCLRSLKSSCSHFGRLITGCRRMCFSTRDDVPSKCSRRNGMMCDSDIVVVHGALVSHCARSKLRV